MEPVLRRTLGRLHVVKHGWLEMLPEQYYDMLFIPFQFKRQDKTFRCLPDSWENQGIWLFSINMRFSLSFLSSGLNFLQHLRANPEGYAHFTLSGDYYNRELSGEIVV